MSEDTREAFNENLPSGVVASLSKVATPDGFLTFERFCAGVKIALLRQEAAARKSKFDDSSVTLDASSGISGRHSVIGGQHDYENVGSCDSSVSFVPELFFPNLSLLRFCLTDGEARIIFIYEFS